MTATDFSFHDLFVDLTMQQRALFFGISDEAAPGIVLADVSSIITNYAVKDYLNKLFLFATNDNVGNSSTDDLTDISSTDFSYAFNLNQWNGKFVTTKTERKEVIKNLLRAIFGAQSDALLNIDVFSNENALDTDISTIFYSRVVADQSTNLVAAGVHGAYLAPTIADSDTYQTSAVNDLDNVQLSSDLSGVPITSTLLRQALNAQVNNPSNNVYTRQFNDSSNTSNTLYGLADGWRTFQFISGDSLQFNVYVDLSKDLLPGFADASLQDIAMTNYVTRYRIKLVATDTSVAPDAAFS